MGIPLAVEAVGRRAPSGAVLVAVAVGGGSVARTEECELDRRQFCALSGVALAVVDVGGGSCSGSGIWMVGVDAAPPAEPSAGEANGFDCCDGGRGLGSRDFAGVPARTLNFCLMPNLEGIVQILRIVSE